MSASGSVFVDAQETMSQVPESVDPTASGAQFFRGMNEEQDNEIIERQFYPNVRPDRFCCSAGIKRFALGHLDFHCESSGGPCKPCQSNKKKCRPIPSTLWYAARQLQAAGVHLKDSAGTKLENQYWNKFMSMAEDFTSRIDEFHKANLDHNVVYIELLDLHCKLDEADAHWRIDHGLEPRLENYRFVKLEEPTIFHERGYVEKQSFAHLNRSASAAGLTIARYRKRARGTVSSTAPNAPPASAANPETPPQQQQQQRHPWDGEEDIEDLVQSPLLSRSHRAVRERSVLAPTPVAGDREPSASPVHVGTVPPEDPFESGFEHIDDALGADDNAELDGPNQMEVDEGPPASAGASETAPACLEVLADASASASAPAPAPVPMPPPPKPSPVAPSVFLKRPVNVHSLAGHKLRSVAGGVRRPREMPHRSGFTRVVKRGRLPTTPRHRPLGTGSIACGTGAAVRSPGAAHSVAGSPASAGTQVDIHSEEFRRRNPLL